MRHAFLHQTIWIIILARLLCSELCRMFGSLQGYVVRKITAMDQDLGSPRGIGYTIVSGLSPGGWGGCVIGSDHNPAAITDEFHRATSVGNSRRELRR